MRSIILSLILFSVTVGSKANDAKSALSATEIVWFGLDFTKTVFAGGFDITEGAGGTTGSDMKTKWIPGWNAMVMSQPEYFDLKTSFRKGNILFDLKSVNELNNKIDVAACMQQVSVKIKKPVIDDMIKQYRPNVKKDGIGLSFIVESFNKETQVADVYVTFFDIAESKVLICEKVSGTALGIGMLNSWSGAIKSILTQIDTSEYTKWENKY